MTSSTSQAMMYAADVEKYFGSFQALKGITLALSRGEVLCIIGPSGSGKSTFLRCINQLERADRGAIWVDGELVGFRRAGDTLHELGDKELARQRLLCGMVFQRFNLFSHMTTLQNIVEGPIVVQKRRRAEVVDEAMALLERVGLADKRDAYPLELSGGQQQRVAITRALAMRPKLMLFDEPTSALDPELVGEVLDVVADLKSRGFTILMATHEMGFARQAADLVCHLEDGVIVEQGSAEQVFTAPEHESTRRFLSRTLGQ